MLSNNFGALQSIYRRQMDKKNQNNNPITYTKEMIER